MPRPLKVIKECNEHGSITLFFILFRLKHVPFATGNFILVSLYILGTEELL
jgi:hypothetical protein